MSRRVSNSRINQFRGLQARQRVRYGWRKKQRMAIAFMQEAQRRLNAETGVTT